MSQFSATSGTPTQSVQHVAPLRPPSPPSHTPPSHAPTETGSTPSPSPALHTSPSAIVFGSPPQAMHTPVDTSVPSAVTHTGLPVVDLSHLGLGSAPMTSVHASPSPSSAPGEMVPVRDLERISLRIEVRHVERLVKQAMGSGSVSDALKAVQAGLAKFGSDAAGLKAHLEEVLDTDLSGVQVGQIKDSLNRVQSLVDGIGRGDPLPIAKLERGLDGRLSVSDGNHRVLAHTLLGSNMPAVISGAPRPSEPVSMPVSSSSDYKAPVESKATLSAPKAPSFVQVSQALSRMTDSLKSLASHVNWTGLRNDLKGLYVQSGYDEAATIQSALLKYAS